MIHLHVDCVINCSVSRFLMVEKMKHSKSHRHELGRVLPIVLRIIEGSLQIGPVSRHPNMPSEKTLRKYVRAVKAQLDAGVPEDEVELHGEKLGRPQMLTDEHEEALAADLQIRHMLGDPMSRDEFCKKAHELAVQNGIQRTYTRITKKLRSGAILCESHTVEKVSCAWLAAFKQRRNLDGQNLIVRKATRNASLQALDVDQEQL